MTNTILHSSELQPLSIEADLEFHPKLAIESLATDSHPHINYSLGGRPKQSEAFCGCHHPAHLLLIVLYTQNPPLWKNIVVNLSKSPIQLFKRKSLARFKKDKTEWAENFDIQNFLFVSDSEEIRQIKRTLYSQFNWISSNSTDFFFIYCKWWTDYF